MYLRSLFSVVVLMAVIYFPGYSQEHNGSSERSKHERGGDIHERKSSEIKHIREKLHMLEEGYLTKLRSRDEDNAKKLVEEVYELLEKVEGKLKHEDIQQVLPPQPQAVSAVEFSGIMESLKREGFSDNKITMLKTFTISKFLSVKQTAEIIRLFMMPNEKITVLEMLYPVVVDKANGYKLIDEFTFSNDKEKAKEIITGK